MLEYDLRAQERIEKDREEPREFRAEVRTGEDIIPRLDRVPGTEQACIEFVDCNCFVAHAHFTTSPAD